MTLRLFADYAKAQGWPEVAELTTSHIEEYLVHLRERPRWFGKRGSQQTPVSDSSIETHYRRLKTFFHWLSERGHVSGNPLDLIKHPRFEERVIPTVGEKGLLALLELINPKHGRTEAEKFRAYRNRAIIWLLVDTPIRRGELGGLHVDDVWTGLAVAKPLKLTGWFSTSYNTSKLRLNSAPTGHPDHAPVYSGIVERWCVFTGCVFTWLVGSHQTCRCEASVKK